VTGAILVSVSSRPSRSWIRKCRIPCATEFSLLEMRPFH